MADLGVEPTEPAGRDVGPVAQERPPTNRIARLLGAAAQVAGVVGIVVCLLLVAGTLLGRGWAIDRVDEVASAIDGGLARGTAVLETTTTRVAETSARVRALADAADALAVDPDPAPALVQALLGDVTSVSDRYLALRTAYADAREAVVAAVVRLNTIDRLLPGLSLPEGPVEALAALDASIRALDARLMELMNANPAAGLVSAWAEGVATLTSGVEAALADVAFRLDAADARVADVRTQVVAEADAINAAITFGAILAILLLLYLALLHWVLLRTGRALRRGPTAEPTESSSNPDDDVVLPEV